MKKFKYDMSIVMPIYNMEKFLNRALDSVLKQDYDFDKIQIVAVNDGSIDSSLNIINDYASKYNNITVINQKNQGLSCTRNNGIRKCLGKYIMFLDPDDYISSSTVSSLVKTFDQYYDLVDLVEYNIVRVSEDGDYSFNHYRYRFLNKDGIYDLNDKYNWYSCVTTVNYCVKNMFEENVLFDETPNFRHEDQKFAVDVLSKKLKIAYTSGATYYYYQHSASVCHTSFYAYYIFDKAISFWESVFNKYKKDVPPYFQALFLHDVHWKTKSDILRPYQYEGEEYDKQYNRIIKLLSRVSDDVILNHPTLSESYKYDFIKKKNNSNITINIGKSGSGFSILNNNDVIYSNNTINLNILRFEVKNGILKLIGYINSPILEYVDKPEMVLVNNKRIVNDVKIDLRKSSYSYDGAKFENCTSWLFEFDLKLVDNYSFGFYLKIDDVYIDTTFIFTKHSRFGSILLPNEFCKCGYKFSLNDNFKLLSISGIQNSEYNNYISLNNKYFFYNDKKVYIYRKMFEINNRFNKNIWLYYDCKGVEKDNAYYQFIHDIKKKDGIKRYYISANSDKMNKKVFGSSYGGRIVKFGSLRHKLLFFRASKVITAYIETKNVYPFTLNTLTKYNDVVDYPEIIYLQHGLLHAHMPWKYSYDRLLIDREVVSSNYEVDNLKNNYSFTDKHIIKSGMPRYDYVDTNLSSKNKILFAPSWRNYLISNDNKNWISDDKKFLNSSFYKETEKFLNSPELHKLLKKYNYTLDFRLHPIFNRYKRHYKINSNLISLNNSNVPISDYKLFITDFSSFVFDFVYLKRSILYFFPDYDLFKSGLNIYRELDIPFEDGFGSFCQLSDDVIKKIDKLLQNNCIPEKKYQDKINDFFLYYDNNQCDRIYDSLVNNESGVDNDNN